MKPIIRITPAALFIIILFMMTFLTMSAQIALATNFTWFTNATGETGVWGDSGFTDPADVGFICQLINAGYDHIPNPPNESDRSPGEDDFIGKEEHTYAVGDGTGGVAGCFSMHDSSCGPGYYYVRVWNSNDLMSAIYYGDSEVFEVSGVNMIHEYGPWWMDTPAPCWDHDGDGFKDEACGGEDCDDTDPDVNPGAEEICDNGIDDDCDGLVDDDDPDCFAEFILDLNASYAAGTLI